MVHSVKPSAAHVGQRARCTGPWPGAEMVVYAERIWECQLPSWSVSRESGWGSHLSCISLIFDVQVTACFFGLKLSLLVIGSYCTASACPFCVDAIGQTFFPQQGQWRHPPSNVLAFPVHSLLRKTSGPCPGNSRPVYLHSVAIFGTVRFLLGLSSAERRQIALFPNKICSHLCYCM